MGRLAVVSLAGIASIRQSNGSSSFAAVAWDPKGRSGILVRSTNERLRTFGKKEHMICDVRHDSMYWLSRERCMVLFLFSPNLGIGNRCVRVRVSLTLTIDPKVVGADETRVCDYGIPRLLLAFVRA